MVPRRGFWVSSRRYWSRAMPPSRSPCRIWSWTARAATTAKPAANATATIPMRIAIQRAVRGSIPARIAAQGRAASGARARGPLRASRRFDCFFTSGSAGPGR